MGSSPMKRYMQLVDYDAMIAMRRMFPSCVRFGLYIWAETRNRATASG